MGLFKKEACCICGKKTGVLKRIRLADDQFLCDDCQDVCCDELLRDGIEKLTSDQMREHMAFMEMCENIFNEEFEDTAVFTGDYMQDDLVLIDERHGWWANCTSNDYSLYLLSDIADITYGIDTSFLLDDEAFNNLPKRRIMKKIIEEVGDVPTCTSNENIDKMYVDVHLKNHPWVKTVRIYALDESHRTSYTTEKCYYDIGHLKKFLLQYAGAKSDPLEDYA